MKSATPKVLHDLCGRPMVMWPVLAAQAAGADHVIVVDSPARPTEAVLPEGVEIAIQPTPDGNAELLELSSAQGRRLVRQGQHMQEIR